MGIQVPISKAKGRLADLVRRAEAGEEVVLTRHGHAAVRLVLASDRAADTDRRTRVFDELRRRAALRAPPAVSAARSQDFLYGEDGLPLDSRAL